MQLDRVSHASDETLEGYAMGSLGEPVLAELEEHLLVCPHCQEQLKEFDSYVAAMRNAAAGLELKDESRKEFWTRVSGALTLRRIGWAMAIAALLVLVLRCDCRGDRRGARRRQPSRWPWFS